MAGSDGTGCLKSSDQTDNQYPLIFQSVYNGPVQYFARIIREENIVIEQFDHYSKQTYRNRCRIAGANGILDLSIPVINEHGRKTRMKDVKIDYSLPWQKNHFRSIQSAYATAPFYEFIIDDFVYFYERPIRFLMDINKSLLEKVLVILDKQINISFTESFLPLRNDGSDPRFFIHPKRETQTFDPEFKPALYNQVFIDKHGFIPNLSILDLLFNEGLNSITILESSYSK